MIRVETLVEPARVAEATASLTRSAQPFCGPDRHPDPAQAFRLDLQDIVAVQGAADEPALILRGWTLAEIIEHLPAARAVDRAEAVA